MMNRTIRKLKCAFGLHEYKDANLQGECLAEDYRGAVYRMSNKCVYCGKEYSTVFRLPYTGR